MAKRHEYVVGEVYGCQKLIALERNSAGRLVASVECIYCGSKTVRVANSLFSNRLNSCMCKKKTMAGLSDSRIYQIYHNMLDRCFNEHCSSYFRYGATGIVVCDEWRGDSGFMSFYDWAIKNGYNNAMTIDRIDNHGNYCPDNCQWVTKAENTARANKTSQHRKADRGTYYGISPDGTRYVFENANQFAREHTELHAGCIRSCAQGLKKTHRGWLFGFLSDICIVESQSTIESTGVAWK